MPVFDLYSRRRRRELGQADDVVQYDVLSPTFRRQCIFIFKDVFGDIVGESASYERFVEALRREFGLATLTKYQRPWPGQELEEFIVSEANDEQALDAIEMIMRVIAYMVEGKGVSGTSRKEAQDAVNEFNERCRQAGLGYALEGNQLVRVDSRLLHADAVKPALALIADPKFINVDSEFRSAHDHWRQGNSAEVLVDCLKAFESTMKVIATERGWVIPARASASQLVGVMFENDLIPSYYQTQMAGLRSTLESGIATPRNRAGGHGAGAWPATSIPDEIVTYVLHLTAATILFLVKAHKSKP